MEICAKRPCFFMLIMLASILHAVTANDSINPSVLDNLCKGVDCGNGTCTVTKESPFVKCDCNEGWRQPQSPMKIPFLACVIPNCTLDYGCSATSPAPSPSFYNRRPHDPLNPCEYNVCGGGDCIRNSTSNHTYQCNCYQGYGNLMNWTTGYCVKECEILSDCKRRGISISGNSTASGPGISPATDINGGNSNNAQGGFKFVINGKPYIVIICSAFASFFMIWS
eukprot:Gb_25296 [translate_table: standard]